jgi:hypothetical protein
MKSRYISQTTIYCASAAKICICSALRSLHIGLRSLIEIVSAIADAAGQSAGRQPPSLGHSELIMTLAEITRPASTPPRPSEEK